MGERMLLSNKVALMTYRSLLKEDIKEGELEKIEIKLTNNQILMLFQTLLESVRYNSDKYSIVAKDRVDLIHEIVEQQGNKKHRLELNEQA